MRAVIQARSVLMCWMVVAASNGVAEGHPLTGTEIPLWPAGAPLAKGDGPEHQPTLTYYLPEKAHYLTGVIVCPGGGYGGLALEHEGEQLGNYLAANGIAAFVLRYRHAPEYQHPVPRMDVQRAIRVVRYRADEFGVRRDWIGVLGFSAGGHLTATSGTQFDESDHLVKDEADTYSARPDFIAPIYPVITMMDPHAHTGSRKNLLGENPDESMVRKMSLETQVTKDTPPVFLVHTTEDQAVPVENALLFYSACRAEGVPVSMHIFDQGKHGLGLGEGRGGTPHFNTWGMLFLRWVAVQDRYVKRFGPMDMPK